MGNGIIWSSGIHNVFVDDKPASVFAGKDTIEQTFDMFQEEIDRSGGITLGIDHIPEGLLNQYPILKKMDVLNVGKITEISHDANRIYATKSEHTNPIIAELYLNGELPAYSIVADFKASKCPTGQSDYILKEIKNIKRTDYVDEGGCLDCKTGIQPDDMIMTAKLSLEVKDMVDKDESIKIDAQDTSNPPVDTDGDAAEDEAETATLQDVVDTVNALATSMKTSFAAIEGNLGIKEPAAPATEDAPVQASKSKDDSKLEARLSTMELRAKKAEVAPIVDNAIKEGRIFPVDKDMFVDKGIEIDDTEKFKELMAKRPVIVDLTEKSKMDAKNSKNKDKEVHYINDLQDSRKSNKF